jgi:hypothetical protein
MEMIRLPHIPLHESFFNYIEGKVMKIKGISLLLGVTLILFFLGCAKITSDVSPDVSINEYKNFYVVPSFDDRRGVKEAIWANLKSRGFTVAIGSALQIPETADIEVTYEAKWVWENEYYLSDLVIFFKNPESDLLIASGESHSPSIKRIPADEMVGEILDEIFP